MKVVGIDLGTTNTYVYAMAEAPASTRDNTGPVPLVLPRISDDAGSIATVVLYEDGKAFLAGNIAESEYYANIQARPRRSLASQFKPEIAGGDAAALKAMQDFLRILHDSLPEGFLEADTRLYVGMPSLAREDFSINLGSCFIAAGWPKPEFLRESDAALISCLQSGVLNIEDIDRKCAIIDFGGGTFDYTLVESMEALRNGGDLLYGGRLFDDLFFQVFCRKDDLFAREAPLSPFAWYLHWIECKAQKENFSDFMRQRDSEKEDAVFSLHAVWFDASGARHDSFVPAYSREDFIRDAENYQASPQMLEILHGYRERGGLSTQARDLLEGRKTALVSWLRAILESIDHRSDVARVVLTGGSSRWFFTPELVARMFRNASCAHSARGYEDIAFGLALYPSLLMSRERTRRLLDKKLAGFTDFAVKKARELAQRQVEEVIRLCGDRIISRDVLPVLESAREKSLTVAEAEKLFSENISGDSGLHSIVEEKSEALGRQIQEELNFFFRKWLKDNGVILAPVFVFPARAISHDFLSGLGVRVSSIDSIKMASFIIANILPVLAALAVGGAIAHSGEPVSTVVGGGAAFGSTWLAARIAPRALRNIRLPAFFLNEKMREKIVRANRAEIEKTLRKSFAQALKEMDTEIERRLRSSLDAMIGQLGVLNQIKTSRV